jgi:hypothetical protein
MPNDDHKQRKLVYALFITVAAGLVAGRILSAELVYEPSLHRLPDEPPEKGRAWPPIRPRPMPTFGSNDRSRWATVRALVDEGTYVIGTRDPAKVSPTNKYGDTGIIFDDGWQSVDKVLRPDTQEFYSSKPPLLATLVAGLYWLLQYLSGWTLKDDPQIVVRSILMLINWLPLVLYLWLLSRLVERHGRTDWGRFYVLAAAAFATMVSLFANTFNNHSIATYCVLFALYPVIKIWEGSRPELAYGWPLHEPPQQPVGKPSPLYFVAAGFFAGFAVCNELPAAAFAAALGLTLLVWHPTRTLAFFVPAALLPLAAFVITNYEAVGQLRPAYSEFGGPWYQYEGSHWQPPAPGKTKPGIDWAGGKETRAEYAFHLFLGHHGLFSLTPIWVLALGGMFVGLFVLLRRRKEPPEGDADGPERAGVPPFLYPLTLAVTVVVLGFYLVRSDNYGGWTNGLRWLMWLSPLWLLCLLPVADRLARRGWSRALGYLFLAVSIFSVNYMSWNPWRHPWLYNLMRFFGWEGY